MERGKGEKAGEPLGEVRGFESLLVWQKSMDMVCKVYQICNHGSLAKDWGLRDQLQRAAVSIPANIAEGYERRSRKEYQQFLGIAKGSAGELRCLVQIAKRLEFIDEKTAENVIGEIVEITKMLQGLMNFINKG